MNTNTKRRKILRVISFFLLFIMVGIVGSIWFWNKSKGVSKKDWEGLWDISYYYENAPGLLYTGTLNVNIRDTIKGQLEVFLPKSTRPTSIKLSGLTLSEDIILLRGAFFYPYKIQEGFLREAFELKLENANKFHGKGQCVAFCAEGTEAVAIIWKGQKSDLSSNKN